MTTLNLAKQNTGWNWEADDLGAHYYVGAQALCGHTLPPAPVLGAFSDDPRDDNSHGNCSVCRRKVRGRRALDGNSDKSDRR